MGPETMAIRMASADSAFNSPPENHAGDVPDLASLAQVDVERFRAQSLGNNQKITIQMITQAFQAHRDGQSRTAEQLCRQVLQRQPGHPDALSLQGYMAFQAGRYDEAVEFFSGAVVAAPSALIHNQLGLALHNKGQLERAIAHYREAVQLDPAHALAQVNLGRALQARGQPDAGIVHCRAALRLAPDMPEAHYSLGLCLHAQGDKQAAATHYRKALGLKPAYAEAHGSLGDILSEAGADPEAILHYNDYLRIRPDHAETCVKLAMSLHRAGYLEDAANHCRRAIRIKPGHVAAYISLGVVLFSLNQFEEALQAYRAALRISPGNMNAVIGEANIYEKMGKDEQAYECLRPWIDADIAAAKVLPLALSLSLQQGEKDRFIRLMEELLEKTSSPPIPREDLISIHFSLGKAYDKRGEFDKAFAHYAKGNAMRPAVFNIDRQEKYFQQIKESYGADFFRSAPRATHGSQRPVFIVGMPRSGTSLVEQILASHSAVAGGGELKGIKQLADGIPTLLGKGATYPQCVAQLTEKHLDSLADRYLQQLAHISADAVRVTDKMPHNFQHLGLIALLFPEARIIHCVRNPLDTCLSCYFQNFGDRHDYSFNLEHLAVHYRQYQQFMAHWKNVLEIPIMDVVYEEHVADPEGFARSLVQFCGLEWEEQCLRFHENKRVVHTSSYDQVNRPIYRDSVQRWKHYDAYLEPLRRGLGMEV